MKYKLFFLAILLVLVDELLGLGVYLPNSALFIVLFLSTFAPSVFGLFLAWFTGLLLDIAVGVHVGAQGFSFLATYLVLLQINRLFMPARIWLCFFAVIFQRLLLLFALSFSDFPIAGQFDPAAIISAAVLAMPAGYLLSRPRRLSYRL